MPCPPVPARRAKLHRTGVHGTCPFIKPGRRRRPLTLRAVCSSVTNFRQNAEATGSTWFATSKNVLTPPVCRAALLLCVPGLPIPPWDRPPQPTLFSTRLWPEWRPKQAPFLGANNLICV